MPTAHKELKWYNEWSDGDLVETMQEVLWKGLVGGFELSSTELEFLRKMEDRWERPNPPTLTKGQRNDAIAIARRFENAHKDNEETEAAEAVGKEP